MEISLDKLSDEELIGIAIEALHILGKRNTIEEGNQYKPKKQRKGNKCGRKKGSKNKVKDVEEKVKLELVEEEVVPGMDLPGSMS